MDIKSLLTPSRTVCGVEGESKKGALEALAKIIAKDIPSINAEDLFRRFLSRERLGSTGIGHGIAIPHCRINNASGEINTPKTIGALITLTKPVTFDAIDSRPVDILFAMLVPEEGHNEHLQNLAELASALNNDQFRQRIRDAKSDDELYQASISHQ